MSLNQAPFFMWSDATTDRIPQQNLDATGNGFIPQAASNIRTITDPTTNLTQLVSDQTFTHRGSKNVIWSSEGYTVNGVTVIALTANQKKATGIHTANAGAGVMLDLSPYRNLTLFVNLASFTGGSSPTIQFEFDELNDDGTPIASILWKPTAFNAAAVSKLSIGPGVAFTQAASAPSTAGAGFGAIAATSGTTYYTFPVTFMPTGQFQWTVTGSPTGIAWTAWLYGMN